MTPTELRRIRKALGWTQVQLAEALGVRSLAVARWEGGARRISEPVARLVQRLRAEARGKAKQKTRRRS